MMIEDKMSNKLKVVYNNFVMGRDIEELVNDDEIEDLIEEIEELDINQLLTKLFYLEASANQKWFEKLNKN